LRRIKLQKAVERGIEQGVKSLFFFAGYSPLENTGKLSKLDEYNLEEEDVAEVFKATASAWQIERFSKQKEIEALNLPEVVKEFTRLRDGLVLVTGPAGNGKSTAFAAIVDTISRERSCHKDLRPLLSDRAGKRI
jgi:Tfp pilus assembly pilus retraction ATPase PilT